MNSIHPQRNSNDRLIDSQLSPHLDAFKQHLSERRYASGTISGYCSCIRHFSCWINNCELDIHQIDEHVVLQFLDDHLPHCDCPQPVNHVRCDLRAALGHLLIVLRANAVIAEPPIGMTSVDVELRRFDDHMNHVRGLGIKTRSSAIRIVGELLLGLFADRPVVISAIKPEDVRQFVASQHERYKSPSSMGSLASALRGYFRFRTFCGDQVQVLSSVLSSPANWQLASLPKALSHDEAERLLGSLGQGYPAARRANAIVRCAFDLGLRRGEVAKLSLDDIDWNAGTIILRKTKSRREDVLPLPATTGRAIADYLKYERPSTTNRAVFVRNIAPRDQPVGPDIIGKTIRQAYVRAGLPYTRAHLLRHTMASRLLEGGSSLKEVADVLRHRSLNTTLIYAKLDSRNLGAVALPWPGSKS
jgi:integrase/recombinase XerC